MRATPDVLQSLAARIREIEAGKPGPGPAAAVELPLIGRLLAGAEPAMVVRSLRERISLSAHGVNGPPSQLGAGALLELLGDIDGAGTWTLGLYWARHACAERGPLVLVDGRGWFYPPAAAALGVDLEHVILVRPTSRPDGQAALDLALRCRAVGAVVGWCDRLIAAEAQRLKLAAEAGGGLGLILRPKGAERGPSFADLRLRIVPLVSTEVVRRVRIEVVRWRGGREGQSLIVEIDDETGDVRVPAELASATARA